MILTPLAGTSSSTNGFGLVLPGNGLAHVALAPGGLYRVASNAACSMRFASDGSSTVTSADILLCPNAPEVWSAGTSTSLSIAGPSGAVVSVTPVRAA